MAIKVPIRTVYDNANNAIGLSEMQAGEAVGYAHGGTGLTSLGTSGQVLQVNETGDGYEFGNKTSVNLNPYLQVANANISFVTKSTAVTTNNALINLINDRMQVANVTSAINTAVNNLVDSAPGTLDTLNELAAALGDDANFSTTVLTLVGTKASNTYVNQTFETKSVALNANNAQNNLINDRLQVANATTLLNGKLTSTASVTLNGDVTGTASFSGGAITITTTVVDDSHNHTISNVDGLQTALDAKIAITDARVEFLQSANTSVTNDASSITTAQNEVDLQDRALVNPAGFITINIGGVNYKLPFFS